MNTSAMEQDEGARLYLCKGDGELFQQVLTRQVRVVETDNKEDGRWETHFHNNL